MPTYLCHGFRWQRRSIRVYVVVQNLDDAAPEWIIRRGTARTLLESFYALFDFLPPCAPPDPRSRRPRAESNGSSSYYYHQQQQAPSSRSRSRSRSQSAASSRQQQQLPPLDFSSKSLPPGPAQAQHDAEDDILSQDWSAVKLLEEYDPLKLDEISRPHAYVADYAVRIDLSVSILDEMARYEEAMRADPDPAMTGAYADEGTPAARKAAAQAAAAAGGGGSSRGKKQPGWLERLRDQLQRGEEIRWYVVVNGDEERNWPDEPPHRQAAAAAAAAESRPPPSRQQQEHHAQYTLQQHIFEGADRDREKDRERLRLELGGDKDILNTDRKPQPPRPPPGRDYYRAAEERRPVVPEKDLPIPTLRPRTSVDAGLRPKTPKSGAIRRLFSRSKNGDESP